MDQFPHRCVGNEREAADRHAFGAVERRAKHRLHELAILGEEQDVREECANRFGGSHVVDPILGPLLEEIDRRERSVQVFAGARELAGEGGVPYAWNPRSSLRT